MTMNEEVQGEWVLVPRDTLVDIAERLERAVTEHLTVEGAAEEIDDVAATTATQIYAILASPSPSQQERTGWSDEAVEAAAEVIWNDLYGARGGAWDNPPADSVTGIEMRATARAALLAASSVSPATGFEVNNLQWQLTGPPGSDIEAATALGTYTINRDELSAGGAYNLWLAGETNDDIFAPYDSLAEAKAAAQVDFDHRVRSCLAPQPSSTDSEVKP